MRHPLRRFSGTLLISVALLAGGCSLMRFFWDQVPDAVVARADDWLDLDPNGERALRARVEPWLERVRREDLPRYADFLRGLAARTADGFDTADAAWAQRRVDTLYADAVQGALDWIVPTLLDLTPSQRHHLALRFRERNTRYRDTYLQVSRRDRSRAIAQRIVHQVERWTGKLDVRQVALVEDGAAKLPDNAQAWYHYRLRMQAGLLALLSKPDPRGAAVRQQLQAWLVARGARQSGDLAQTDAFRERLAALLVRLAGTLSATQRADAVRGFRNLAAQLDEVAAGANPADMTPATN